MGQATTPMLNDGMGQATTPMLNDDSNIICYSNITVSKRYSCLFYINRELNSEVHLLQKKSRVRIIVLTQLKEGTHKGKSHQT